MTKFKLTSHHLSIPGEGSSFLTFSKGDLIVLDDSNTGETVQNSGWCVGTCERTDQRGDFPAEAVYVLPCLTKPPNDILALFTMDVGDQSRRLYPSQLNGTEQVEKPHTLEEYAVWP